QAEDGIRDDLVTGVQTCALPICLRHYRSTWQTDEHPGVYRHASTGAGLRDGREPQALTHRAVSSRQSESADLGECMIANVLSESRSVTISRRGWRQNPGCLRVYQHLFGAISYKPTSGPFRRGNSQARFLRN